MKFIRKNFNKIVGTALFVLAAAVVVLPGAYLLMSASSSPHWASGLSSSSEQLPTFNGTVTMLIAFFSLGGAFFAYDTIKSASVDRTTFELIQRYVHDEDLIDLVDKFRAVRVSILGDQQEPIGSNGEVINFVDLRSEYFENLRVDDTDGQQTKDPSTPAWQQTRSPNTRYEVIIRLLNSYEAVAVGINSGAINREMMKEWWRRTYVLDFIDLYVFVVQFRIAKADPAFCEIAEEVARKWLQPDEKKKLRSMELLAAQKRDIVRAKPPEYRIERPVLRRLDRAAG